MGSLAVSCCHQYSTFCLNCIHSASRIPLDTSLVSSSPSSEGIRLDLQRGLYDTSITLLYTLIYPITNCQINLVTARPCATSCFFQLPDRHEFLARSIFAFFDILTMLGGTLPSSLLSPT